MNRKLLVIVISLTAACLLGVVVALVLATPEQQSDSSDIIIETSEQMNVYVFTYDHPTDIMFIGDVDSIELDKMWKYRTLEAVDTDSLKRDKKYEFSYLIINDLNGSVCLTEQELLVIKEKLETDRRFNMIYLGSNFEKLLALEAYSEDEISSFGEIKMLEFVFAFGERCLGIGGYTEGDQLHECLASLLKEGVVNAEK